MARPPFFVVLRRALVCCLHKNTEYSHVSPQYGTVPAKI